MKQHYFYLSENSSEMIPRRWFFLFVYIMYLHLEIPMAPRGFLVGVIDFGWSLMQTSIYENKMDFLHTNWGNYVLEYLNKPFWFVYLKLLWFFSRKFQFCYKKNFQKKKWLIKIKTILCHLGRVVVILDSWQLPLTREDIFTGSGYIHGSHPPVFKKTLSHCPWW